MNLYDIDSEKLHEHFSFKVDLGQNPLRVDKFLMLRVENVTRNKIQKAALNGSIRVILGISFALVLAGELLATDKGLGWLMILSERYLQTGRMLVIVIIFIIYAIILNITYIKFSNKVNHWKN